MVGGGSLLAFVQRAGGPGAREHQGFPRPVVVLTGCVATALTEESVAAGVVLPAVAQAFGHKTRPEPWGGCGLPSRSNSSGQIARPNVFRTGISWRPAYSTTSSGTWCIGLKFWSVMNALPSTTVPLWQLTIR